MPGTAAQRLITIAFEEDLRCLRVLRVVCRQQVGVVRREAPHRQDRAVARIENHDGALLRSQRFARELLHVFAHRQRDVARGLVVDEEVAQRLVLLRHRLAAQLVVVRLLDTRRTEVEVERAGDVTEQVTLGIRALERELIAGC